MTLLFGNRLGQFRQRCLLRKVKRFAVETETQAGFFARAIVEDVAEVSVAARAGDLYSCHAVAVVFVLGYIFLADWLKEAWPTGA